MVSQQRPFAAAGEAGHDPATAGQARLAITVLVVLIFSKYIYLAGITNYDTFYMMHRFGLTTRSAQICQFVFFAAVATGTIIGGPVGDRIGRKKVIWVSIFGVLSFTLALPYVGFEATIALSIVIGVVISSAFLAIVVYVQDLFPERTGDDVRPVLRPDLRRRWHRRRRARQPGRSLRRRVRLRALLRPAGDRAAQVLLPSIESTARRQTA